LTASPNRGESTRGWPSLEIQVKCSKGTYIRSLAHDIGQKLSCGACLEKLIRTEIGKFNIKNSVKLKVLNPKNWTNHLIVF
jgi:tRNA pseudouridine55 synthase